MTIGVLAGTMNEATKSPTIYNYSDLFLEAKYGIPRVGGTISSERELIWRPVAESYARKYGVDTSLMADVINCESGWNPSVHNERDPNGGSYGLGQYQWATFYKNAPFLFEKPDIHDPHQQLELMAYMWSKGQAGQWSCWYLIQGRAVPWQ